MIGTQTEKQAFEIVFNYRNDTRHISKLSTLVAYPVWKSALEKHHLDKRKGKWNKVPVDTKIIALSKIYTLLLSQHKGRVSIFLTFQLCWSLFYSKMLYHSPYETLLVVYEFMLKITVSQDPKELSDLASLPIFVDLPVQVIPGRYQNSAQGTIRFGRHRGVLAILHYWYQ